MCRYTTNILPQSSFPKYRISLGKLRKLRKMAAVLNWLTIDFIFCKFILQKSEVIYILMIVFIVNCRKRCEVFSGVSEEITDMVEKSNGVRYKKGTKKILKWDF
jgi:hypothetical protein